MYLYKYKILKRRIIKNRYLSDIRYDNIFNTYLSETKDNLKF